MSAIKISDNGIEITSPAFVAGDTLLVLVTAQVTAPLVVVSARFSGETLLRIPPSAFDEQMLAETTTANRAVALFMLTARADESRDVVVEMFEGDFAGARATFPLRNSALLREKFPDLYPRPPL